MAVAMLVAVTGACAGRPSGEPEQSRPTQRESPNSAIDAELARQWAELGLEPSPLASDAEFLRRVSLDLIGRVPTRAEVEEFLADEHPNKRARLVDRLLISEQFASRWASLWADQLLPTSARARRIAGPALETHLTAALHDNRSWATVVDQLLTANGELGRDSIDQPELGFLASRATGKQPREEQLAELASTTSRVFLGAKIECAQCHDHPYDSSFSRVDFWAQAALFGRTKITLDRRGEGPPSVTIGERSRGELRVALDPAGQQPEVIAPRFMGSVQPAEPAQQEGSESRRVQLAAAIIADPRFAEATVGQIWSRLLGRGIVEPWDDLLGAGERPALLTLLATQFRASDHDVRALIRSIVLSQAYQRSSTGPQTSTRAIAAAEAGFARAAVRPLSADQLFASLVVVTGLEQVEDRGFRRAVRQRRAAAVREYAFVFGDDEMSGTEGFSGNVPQALLLLNGGLTNHGVVSREGSSLAAILAASEATDTRLEDLWLTVHGRRPTAAELVLGRDAVGPNPGPEAWEDLMFALLYSTEFGSNH